MPESLAPKTIPELGQLVDHFPNRLPEYRRVVDEWAKHQVIPPSEDRALRGAVGETEVILDGEKATVGWVDGMTAPYLIEKPENIVVTEGGFVARIVRTAEDSTASAAQTVAAAAHGGQSYRLSLKSGDMVSLSHPHGPEGRAWFIRFRPEED